MRKLRLRDVNFLCVPHKEEPDTNSSVPCPSQTGDSVLTEKMYSPSRQSEGCVFGSVRRVSRKRNGVRCLWILSFLAAGLLRLDGQGDLWLSSDPLVSSRSSRKEHRSRRQR